MVIAIVYFYIQLMPITPLVIQVQDKSFGIMPLKV
jgi:hypothetical protein